MGPLLLLYIKIQRVTPNSVLRACEKPKAQKGSQKKNHTDTAERTYMLAYCRGGASTNGDLWGAPHEPEGGGPGGQGEPLEGGERWTLLDTRLS